MAKRKEINYAEILKKECDVIVKHINKRYNQGLNTNVYVIGLSGTGKSSTSLRVSEKIVESRDETTQVFLTDSFLGFLKAIRNSKEGDIIIIEEVSVLFPSRRAMARENVNVGKVMDTCRKKRLCIISNAPLWNSIDSHMRAMGHLLVETLKIVKKFKVVVSKFHRLQTNPLTGKTYRHTMQRHGRDINRLVTQMPNKERWDEYEREKDKFMDELYNRMEFEQNKKKAKLDKEMGVVQPKIEELSERELQVHQLVNRKGLNQSQAARQMGISSARVTVLMQNIRKKTQNPLEKRGFKVKDAPITAMK